MICLDGVIIIFLAVAILYVSYMYITDIVYYVIQTDEGTIVRIVRSTSLKSAIYLDDQHYFYLELHTPSSRIKQKVQNLLFAKVKSGSTSGKTKLTAAVDIFVVIADVSIVLTLSTLNIFLIKKEKRKYYHS